MGKEEGVESRMNMVGEGQNILLHLGEAAGADLDESQLVLKKPGMIQGPTYNRDELIQHVLLYIRCCGCCCVLKLLNENEISKSPIGRHRAAAFHKKVSRRQCDCR